MNDPIKDIGDWIKAAPVTRSTLSEKLGITFAVMVGLLIVGTFVIMPCLVAIAAMWRLFIWML